MTKKTYIIHPLIALKEKHQEELVALSGYPGSAESGHVKLYTDLSADTYYEVPEKAILHEEAGCKDCGDESRMKFYVLASSDIKLVKKMKAFQADNIPRAPFSPYQDFTIDKPYPQFDTDDLRFPFSSGRCYANCLNQIRHNKSYQTEIPANPNGFIIRINSKGKTVLYNCLKKCGYRNPLLLFVWKHAIEILEYELSAPGQDPDPEIPTWP